LFLKSDSNVALKYTLPYMLFTIYVIYYICYLHYKVYYNIFLSKIYYNMQPYNVFYNNHTGRVVIQNNKPNLSPIRCRSQSPVQKQTSQENLNNFFVKKIEELSKNRSKSPVSNFYKKISSLLQKPIYNEKNNTQNMFLNETQNNTTFKYKNCESDISNNYDITNEIAKMNTKRPELNNTRNMFSDEIYSDEYTKKDNTDEISDETQKTNITKIELNKRVEIENLNYLNNSIIIKKDLTYGIKKTILSDFNYLYASSNCNDFKVGINKNNNQINTIFDVFYLFPNISEINTKNETNIINEKKVEIFGNRFLDDDKQYFPIDYIPCGITIPLRTNVDQFTKLKIKNIFWNIFQSIDSNNYKTNELFAVVPDKNEFGYIPIAFQINFELHSQLSDRFLNSNTNQILPYRNTIKSINPANSCLFKAHKFTIENLNGSNFSDIDIEIPANLNLDCAMLCIKISVPDGFISILKGTDKYNKVFYGFIPFSQFVLNFDYELSV